MNTIFILTVSGDNQPGICAQITKILANHDADVLDIGQSAVHDSLSLGFVVSLQDASSIESLQAELTAETQDFGLKVRVRELSIEAYEAWVAAGTQSRHVVTLLSRRLTASSIAAVSRVLGEFNLDIYDISRKTGRLPLTSVASQSKACVEFVARGKVADTSELRKQLMALGSDINVDVAYQEDNIYRRNRRLAVFDMDSTLIQHEVIDELAKHAGSGEMVSEITEQAMRGELDFKESLRARVATLKGLPESTLETVAQDLKLSEGAEKLLSTLGRLGFKTAILSGGFTYFGDYLSRKLGIDYVHANQLEIIDGVMTGKVIGEIVDGQKKADLLRQIANEHDLTLDQTMAVGDGANDLPMLSIAGMGVAFHAKPLVKESAEYSVSTLGLDAVLYLMGLSDTEL